MLDEVGRCARWRRPALVAAVTFIVILLIALVLVAVEERYVVEEASATEHG